MRKTKTARSARAEQDRPAPFRIELSKTEVGSPVLNIRYVGDSRTLNERQRSAFIYLLAAELEQGTDAVGGRWVISPETYRSRIIVEIGSDGEDAITWSFVRSTLVELGLG
jgi:hypothetical protein